MLTAQDLHEAFMELGSRAQREGKVIDLAIYGESALMLASSFRVTTQDVDANCVPRQVWRGYGQRQGKKHEAHRKLSAIYNWFTEGFDTKDLQEAKALLHGLGSGV